MNLLTFTTYGGLILLIHLTLSSCSCNFDLCNHSVHAQYSIDSLSKKEIRSYRIKVPKGPEDIALDSSNSDQDRLIISSTKFNIFGNLVKGNLSYYELATGVQKNFIIQNLDKKTIKQIRPHGIYLNDDKLYVISHEQHKKVHKIYIFKVSSDSLYYTKSYSSEEYSVLSYPNDLTVSDQEEIYFSNPYDALEVYCKGQQGHIGYLNTQTNESDTLIKNLDYPNGIVLDGRWLYLSTHKDGRLRRFDIRNQLKEEVIADTICGGDNINISNQLILVAHQPEPPKAINYFVFGSKYPSSVYAYHPPSNQSQFLFYSNGKAISGSSSALIYNKVLYIAQIKKSFLLSIPLEEKAKK